MDRLLNFLGKKVSTSVGLSVVLASSVSLVGAPAYSLFKEEIVMSSYSYNHKKNIAANIADEQELTSWQNYESSNFALKYPGEGSYYEPTSGIKLAVFRINDGFFLFEVARWAEFENEKEFDSFRESLKEDNLEFKEKRIPLADTTAIELSYKEDRLNGTFYRVHSVYALNDGLGYNIYSTFDASKEGFYEPIFYTMLSSFQFK